jgi:hypothetical protein
MPGISPVFLLWTQFLYSYIPGMIHALYVIFSKWFHSYSDMSTTHIITLGIIDHIYTLFCVFMKLIKWILSDNK